MVNWGQYGPHRLHRAAPRIPYRPSSAGARLVCNGAHIYTVTLRDFSEPTLDKSRLKIAYPTPAPTNESRSENV